MKHINVSEIYIISNNTELFHLQDTQELLLNVNDNSQFEKYSLLIQFNHL